MGNKGPFLANLAGKLSILCGEDPGPFPILFTRVKFSASSPLCRCHFFFPLLFSPTSLLFADGAVVKISYSTVRNSVSRRAFGVASLWQWMDKCRLVLVVRGRHFQRVIFPPRTHQTTFSVAAATLSTPITLFLNNTPYPFIMSAVFPLWPVVHCKQHGEACTYIPQHCVVPHFGANIDYH